MTSEYAKNRGLSQKIISLWTQIGKDPRDAGDRLRFYLAYFPEVLPYGVTVHHIPSKPPNKTTQEVQFCLHEGKIFICGLILAKEMYAANVQQLVADEKYTKPSDKDMVISEDGSWRFFTAGAEVKMYNRLRNNEYELLGVFDPIRNAWELAAFLQRQYYATPRRVEGFTESW